MEDRYEIMMAGQGGQGIVLAAVILAEAAARYDGLHAAQTQSYGPAARGGVVQAEVVISRSPIDYPKVEQADVLLALSQPGFDAYSSQAALGALLVVDSVLVQPPEGCDVVAAPITRLAEEKTGTAQAANMVALGLLVGLCGAVSRQALESAVRARVPGGSLDRSLVALGVGLGIASEHGGVRAWAAGHGEGEGLRGG